MANNGVLPRLLTVRQCLSQTVYHYCHCLGSCWWPVLPQCHVTMLPVNTAHAILCVLCPVTASVTETECVVTTQAWPTSHCSQDNINSDIGLWHCSPDCANCLSPAVLLPPSVKSNTQIQDITLAILAVHLHSCPPNFDILGTFYRHIYVHFGVIWNSSANQQCHSTERIGYFI